MKQSFLPWKLRRSDFERPGWHTRPTIGYELMFEFLRLSPSYELARRHQLGELSKEEIRQLPADFGDVLKTFALLGDVQKTLFRTWWLERGMPAFGSPSSKPRVHKLTEFTGDDTTVLKKAIPRLEDYLLGVRPDEGLPSVMLLAVPLGGRKSEVLAVVTKLLDDHQTATKSDIKPRIALLGQRLRAKVLFNGIRLLWFRAAKPKWELWRLGAKARISKTYSFQLSVDAPRKVADLDEMYDREMMSKITSRALAKFEAIAENAARGRFPSESAVEKAHFDWPDIAKRIRMKNTWEDRAKRTMLADFESRRNRLIAAAQ